MPTWIRHLFRRFPLLEWAPAQVASPNEVDDAPTKAQLYIVPGRSGAWASRDAVCLRWQMELLLRDAEFECVPLADPYWAPEGQLPFLRLPSRRLVPRSELAHAVENAFPCKRAELGEDTAMWPDESTAQEHVAWTNLLAQRVMPGVIFSAISAGWYAANDDEHVPLLRAWLGAVLPGESCAEQRALATLAELSSARASVPSLRSVFGPVFAGDTWNPLSLVPGFSVEWVGLVSGASEKGKRSDTDANTRLSLVQFDDATILAAAAEALAAVAARLVQESSPQWLLGARHATALDALLFAAVYTLKALPPALENPLLAALASHDSLAQHAARLAQKMPQEAGHK
ncbi:hypothetical protein MSPP1_000432 [Malassezia sp. CBS 17886]|nr:hypothetical protein MSPP1_000432 [Malassezia sp. CBS 17886]